MLAWPPRFRRSHVADHRAWADIVVVVAPEGQLRWAAVRPWKFSSFSHSSCELSLKLRFQPFNSLLVRPFRVCVLLELGPVDGYDTGWFILSPDQGIRFPHDVCSVSGWAF